MLRCFLSSRAPAGRSQLHSMQVRTVARRRRADCPSYACEVGAHAAGGGVVMSSARPVARLGGGQRVVMNTEPRGREVAARGWWVGCCVPAADQAPVHLYVTSAQSSILFPRLVE